MIEKMRLSNHVQIFICQNNLFNRFTDLPKHLKQDLGQHTLKYILHELRHIIAKQEEVEFVKAVYSPDHVGRKGGEVVFGALSDVPLLGVAVVLHVELPKAQPAHHERQVFAQRRSVDHILEVACNDPKTFILSLSCLQ